MTLVAPPAPKHPLGRRQKMSLAHSRGRVNLWEGSVRAGKTFISFLRFCAFVAAYTGPGAIVIIGKSRDTVYRNVFEPIETEPSLAFLRPLVQYTQGATKARVMGVTVHILGANDASSESKIRGMTVGGAYGDEVTVWPEAFFKQLLARMSPPGAQLFATTNPDNPRHWLKVDYIDRHTAGKLPAWRHFHMTMEDNPGLTEAYKANLRAEYAGLWFKRFILGLWVSAEGAIYDDWDEARHVIAWARLPKLQRLLGVGLDFGTSHPSSAILLGVTDEHDDHGRPTPRLVAIDEWRWDSAKTMQRLAPSAQSAKFKQWLARPHTPEEERLDEVERPPYVFRDPAALDFGEQLRLDGITAWKADNDHAGISDIANLLHAGRMIITDRCWGIRDEAPGYVWDPKASAHGRDEPVKEHDDSLDAWRYIVRSTKNVWGPILRRAYGRDFAAAA